MIFFGLNYPANVRFTPESGQFLAISLRNTTLAYNLIPGLLNTSLHFGNERDRGGSSPDGKARPAKARLSTGGRIYSTFKRENPHDARWTGGAPEAGERGTTVQAETRLCATAAVVAGIPFFDSTERNRAWSNSPRPPPRAATKSGIRRRMSSGKSKT